MSKNWMLTHTRRKVFPLDMTLDDIDIADIAHSLSKQCRYNGHVDDFYSVAEHSVLLSLALERDGYPHATVLTGLLHDASECYIGDIIKPIKNALDDLGFSLKPIELGIEKLISEKFNLPWGWPDVIHEYDRRIVRDEKDQLKADESDDWASFNIPVVGLGVDINAWNHRRAYSEFMARFRELTWRG